MKINFYTTGYTKSSKKPSAQSKEVNNAFATQLSLDKGLNYSLVQNNISFRSQIISNRILAESLHKTAKENAGEFINFFQNLTKDTDFSTKFRIKEPYSIDNKLKKYKPLDDLIGGMVITDGSKESSDLFISRFLNSIKSTNIEIKKITNAGTKNTEGYICNKDIEKLKKEFPAAEVNSGKDAVRNDGYPTCYIQGFTKDIPFELQLKGYEINEITNPAHIIYDLITGKDLCSGTKKNPHLIKELKEAISKLSPTQSKQYEIYRKNCFETARNIEINKTRIPYPILPDDIPDKLSYQNVLEVYNKTK